MSELLFLLSFGFFVFFVLFEGFEFDPCTQLINITFWFKLTLLVLIFQEFFAQRCCEDCRFGEIAVLIKFLLVFLGERLTDLHLSFEKLLLLLLQLPLIVIIVLLHDLIQLGSDLILLIKRVR